MLSSMDMREYREHLERIESERRKFAEETDRFLAVLMEQADEYAESICALRALKGILSSLAFLHIERCIRHEDWTELNRELSDAGKFLEEVRQIEIRQESVRNLDVFSAWDAQKTQYLICAEVDYRDIKSRASYMRPSYLEFASSPPPAAPKPKEEKKPSWWKRLFKWKAFARKPEPYCPAAMIPTPRDDDPWDEDVRPGSVGTVVMDMDSFLKPFVPRIEKPDPLPVTVDEVFFTAVAPKEFQRDEYTDVTLVMYEDEYRHILDRIKENYDEKVAEYGSGAKQVAKQTMIRVTIGASEKEIQFEDTRAIDIWGGKFLEFHFWVLVPEAFQKKQFKLTLQVYADGIPLTTLGFYVKCRAASKQEIQPERQDAKSVFVSYARADMDQVTDLVRGMVKVRPDLDVFMDVDRLRSGQNWQEVLKAEIERRDMLFLCWSPSAKASEWVDFEWRHMYNKRGIEHIDPVPLISPQSCPPPEELAMLHFDDRWLHYRKIKAPAETGGQVETVKNAEPGYICIKNYSDGQITTFRKRSILIGRGEKADLRLTAFNISRCHMEITITGEQSFRVSDLNSMNGSFLVNGNRKIRLGAVTVKSGTKLRLADEIIEIL